MAKTPLNFYTRLWRIVSFLFVQMLYFAGTNSRFYTTYTFLTLRLSSLKRLLYELNVKLPEEDARVTDSKSKLKSFLLKNASGVASGDEPSGTRIRKVEIFTIYFSCKSKLWSIIWTPSPSFSLRANVLGDSVSRVLHAADGPDAPASCVEDVPDVPAAKKYSANWKKCKKIKKNDRRNSLLLGSTFCWCFWGDWSRDKKLCSDWLIFV